MTPKVVIDGIVRAAGGVVVRAGPRPQVLLVHRPAHDDWSFPKGHLEPGEDDLSAALREVREETGLECEPVRDLGELRHRDAKDRPKAVRYWEMRARTGELEPDDEVDEVRWVDLAEAPSVLTYEGDRSLLARVGDPADR